MIVNLPQNRAQTKNGRGSISSESYPGPIRLNLFAGADAKVRAFFDGAVDHFCVGESVSNITSKSDVYFSAVKKRAV